MEREKKYPARTVKMILEYDGTRYAGWQSQKKGELTIQDTVEKAVAVIIGKRVPVIASGRTDAGVHAWAQPVSLKGHFPVDDTGLMRGLNSLLPDDIAITHLETVDDGFNAMGKAKEKTYRYEILNKEGRSPLRDRYMWHIIQKLNVADMRRAAEALPGKHDFSAFQATNSSVKSSVRTIIAVEIHKRDDRVVIEVTANGFLKHMVRIIVGTLVEIGRGRFAPERMKEIVASKDRRKAGPTAPAKGLVLVKVEY